mgnify:FL=1
MGAPTPLEDALERAICRLDLLDVWLSDFHSSSEEPLLLEVYVFSLAGFNMLVYSWRNRTGMSLLLITRSFMVSPRRRRHGARR